MCKENTFLFTPLIHFCPPLVRCARGGHVEQLVTRYRDRVMRPSTEQRFPNTSSAFYLCTVPSRVNRMNILYCNTLLFFLCHHTCHFIVVLRSVRTVAKSVCLLCHITPSVCPYVSLRVPSDWFSLSLILGTSVKICRGNPNLVKMGEKYRSLYMKT